jgi:hypothetical protein
MAAELAGPGDKGYVASKDEIVGLGLRSDRPHPNTTIDLSQHKLSPTEGFVLSRVDGRMSYDEICMMAGLGRDETLRILRELKQARLILGPGEVALGSSRKGSRTTPPVEAAAGSRGSAPARVAAAESARIQTAGRPATPVAAAAKPRGKAPEPASSRAAEKASRTPIGPLQRLDDGSEVTAGDLVDWPDAPGELKARIIRIHRRLRQLSAWDLLGVEKDAASPTIRRAFGVASKELHPDRYFGKNLGSFKAKLAAIFNRLSEAVQEIERSRKDKD